MLNVTTFIVLLAGMLLLFAGIACGLEAIEKRVFRGPRPRRRKLP